MNLTNLRFLNLCYNPLSKAVHFQESKFGPTDKIVENILPLNVDAEVQNKDTNKCRSHLESCYFDDAWSLEDEKCKIYNLKSLILNYCCVDLRTLECLLKRLPNLEELHLSSNNYEKIDLSDDFKLNSLKTLFLNSNHLSDWDQVIKLGKCFPQLETLVLSENQLGDFNFAQDLVHELKDVFPNLRNLNLNELCIKNWSTISTLRILPSLKNLRVKGKF